MISFHYYNYISFIISILISSLSFIHTILSLELLSESKKHSEQTFVFPAGFYTRVNGEKCYCVILLGQNISSGATYKLTLLYRKHIFKCFHKTRLTSCSIFNKGESPPSRKFNSTSLPSSCDKVVVLSERCWSFSVVISQIVFT